jgi:hypothetical protein
MIGKWGIQFFANHEKKRHYILGSSRLAFYDLREHVFVKRMKVREHGMRTESDSVIDEELIPADVGGRGVLERMGIEFPYPRWLRSATLVDVRKQLHFTPTAFPYFSVQMSRFIYNYARRDFVHEMRTR